MFLTDYEMHVSIYFCFFFNNCKPIRSDRINVYRLILVCVNFILVYNCNEHKWSINKVATRMQCHMIYIAWAASGSVSVAVGNVFIVHRIVY